MSDAPDRHERSANSGDNQPAEPSHALPQSAADSKQTAKPRAARRSREGAQKPPAARPERTRPERAKSAGAKAASGRPSGSTRGRKQTEARNSEPDMICLPALQPEAAKAKPRSRKKRASAAPQASACTLPATPAPHPFVAPAAPLAAPSAAADRLPEYRSQTDGLRELLSAIDPHDEGLLHALLASPHSSIEETMYLADSRPAIPGSPDLPVSPLKWLRFAGNAIAGLFLLLLAGLLYSHFASPAGINWALVGDKATAALRWTGERLGQAPPNPADTAPSLGVAANGVPGGDESAMATVPRFATPSASASEPLLEAAPQAGFNMTADELERQVRALEQELPAVQMPPGPAAATGATENTAADAADDAREEAAPPSREEKQALRAASIDPAMEQQIFARATTYLRQRDIASARVILHYAVSLGSGISAMALAETYDPAYLAKISLQGVDADVREARKWYKTAAEYGVKEAQERLAALK